MTADRAGNRASAIQAVLNWAYDRAKSSLPGLGSAEDLARVHLERSGGLTEAAIDSLVARQIGYAGAAGFVTGLGGVVTLPFALPANVASVLMIQLRMVAAIASLRGYAIEDERVRTLAFVCLAGSAGLDALQNLGVGAGQRLTAHMTARIPAAALARINQAVGFRLVTRGGTAGLVNLGRMVPLVGGVMGGGFDAAVTRGIAAAARRLFPPRTEE